MSDDTLTLVETCALVTLMGEAREVPNAFLRNVRHLDLKKESRDRLVKRGLISVRKEGQRLFLELTEPGWRRAIVEIGADVPPRAGCTGAALYTVLASIQQFLDRARLAPAEFFAALDDANGDPPATPLRTSAPRPDALPSIEIEARIRKAYDKLTPTPGAWVTLATLRGLLPALRRTDVDETLVRLSRAPDVRLIPESNQKTLTDDERAAAVSIGNQDKHLIAIGS